MIRVLFFILLFSTSLSAKIITVTSGADTGLGTLRQAVENAEPNDTIVFADSIKTVRLNGGIDLEKNIIISGNSIENTIITCTWRHFYIPIAETPNKAVNITLNNLTLKDGYAPNCGGAIFNREGGNMLTLNNCQFINNSVGSFGGAVDNSSILIVNNCLFKNNACLIGSAVLYNSGGEMIINNSVFIGNTASNNAGVILNNNFAIIRDCVFIGNKGTEAGVLLNRGEITFINCLLTENISTGFDNKQGAIKNKWPTSTEPKKMSVKIVNTTIVNNIGEGIYSEQELVVQNSIVYNNTAENDIKVASNNNTSIAHSLVGKSNANINGNYNIINQNPLFVGNGNYSLQKESPAIDAGNNSLYSYTNYPTDLLGNNRISNNIIDLGAYELQIAPPTITLHTHKLSIEVDSTNKLTAVVNPQEASQQLTWRSTNENIATVDDNGNVTGKATGETIIIASVGSVHDTCRLTVTKYQDTVTLHTHVLLLEKDSVAKLRATISSKNAANLKITWKSENENIATVDTNGFVTGRAKGETIVIATAGNVHDTCSITVTTKAGITTAKATERVVRIYPNPANNILHINTTEKIKAITIYDTKGCTVKHCIPYTNAVSVLELPKGVYILKIKTLNRETTQQFIKR